MAEQPVAERLPRGRHGLTRAEVSSAQRGRILWGLAEAMSEQGFAATSVADIIRRAGVSRETFYEQYRSKQACFMDAYDVAAKTVLAGLAATPRGTPETSPAERLDVILDAYLDRLAAAPAFARLFLIEVYGAGPEALAQRARLQERFTAVVIEVIGARSARERFACEALVAAISSMVTARIGAGDLDGLRALRAPLSDLTREALARR